MGLLTRPLPTSASRRSLTRKNLLDWLAERKTASLPDILSEFHGVDQATALRQAIRNHFPKTPSDVYRLKKMAENVYRMADPVPKFFKALSLIVRLRDEGRVYITDDASTIMPAKGPSKEVMSHPDV